jgi:hypothetical protein
MFLGWSSTKFLFFVPVGYLTWLPGPIICSQAYYQILFGADTTLNKILSSADTKLKPPNPF